MARPIGYKKQMFGRFLGGALAGSVVAAALALATVPVQAQVQTGHQAEQSGSLRNDVSPPLRQIPPSHSPDTRPDKHLLRHPIQSAQGAASAPSQPAAPRPAIPASSGFEGVGDGFTGPAGTFAVGSAPPDTNGAVGPNHILETVNTDFAVFNKTGTPVYGPVAINTLWSSFGGGCQTHNDGDPVVLYDQLADRFVVAQMVINTTPFLICVAVSQTSDPTGSYYRYAFREANFPDYPKLSVWPDGYYLTTNQFNASGTKFLGGQVEVLERAQMLTGGAARRTSFNVGTGFDGLLTSNLDGSRLPPAGSPNYVLALKTSTSLAFWKFHTDWSNVANTSLTSATSIGVASYAQACGGGTCIPQSGTSQQLDSLGDRLMFRLAYRNLGDHESLVVNHSVNTAGTVGVRWYEIRVASQRPSLYQQGTYAPDASYRWMGSIAIDRVGNMGLGFSASSSSLHPEIHYTGRLATDALGTMGQSEGTIIAGAGSQDVGLSRWGDYSSMWVDPVDECTFCFSTEYLSSSGIFYLHTLIGTFKFPSCPSLAVSQAPQGNWRGTYGADGYALLGWSGSSDLTLLPPQAAL